MRFSLRIVALAAAAAASLPGTLGGPLAYALCQTGMSYTRPSASTSSLKSLICLRLQRGRRRVLRRRWVHLRHRPHGRRVRRHPGVQRAPRHMHGRMRCARRSADSLILFFWQTLGLFFRLAIPSASMRSALFLNPFFFWVAMSWNGAHGSFFGLDSSEASSMAKSRNLIPVPRFLSLDFSFRAFYCPSNPHSGWLSQAVRDVLLYSLFFFSRSFSTSSDFRACV
ncbi:hypothetical protein DFH11DRAFT_1271557 [Phellopilus nigrolimitatus]|nr:hypothetical protein DFH11DRAFT_1271557 [Phellopilus nigrolimitatus]